MNRRGGGRPALSDGQGLAPRYPGLALPAPPSTEGKDAPLGVRNPGDWAFRAGALPDERCGYTIWRACRLIRHNGPLGILTLDGPEDGCYG
jgi:hypothetical protein